MTSFSCTEAYNFRIVSLCFSHTSGGMGGVRGGLVNTMAKDLVARTLEDFRQQRYLIVSH